MPSGLLTRQRRQYMPTAGNTCRTAWRASALQMLRPASLLVCCCQQQGLGLSSSTVAVAVLCDVLLPPHCGTSRTDACCLTIGALRCAVPLHCTLAHRYACHTSLNTYIHAIHTCSMDQSRSAAITVVVCTATAPALWCQLTAPWRWPASECQCTCPHHSPTSPITCTRLLRGVQFAAACPRRLCLLGWLDVP